MARPFENCQPIPLNEGWFLRSSAELRESGRVLSTRRSTTEGWHAATAPSTVLGALVGDGTLADPYSAANFWKLPGLGPPAENFSNFAMPADSPFRKSWWYRKEFTLARSVAADHHRLRFDGINYRANVWLNGELVAPSSRIAGAYRIHELDVSSLLIAHGTNVLTLEVFPPEPDDLALTWVDWNPSPPDKNMGLWREVWLLPSGPVALRHSQVSYRLDNLETAELSIGVDVCNLSQLDQRGVLEARCGAIVVRREVQLRAGEQRRIELDTREHPALELRNPRLWWPRQLGPQNLYSLELDFMIDGRVSHVQRTVFGIRRVTCEKTEAGHALFRINGKPLLIRGAGFACDMLLRSDAERETIELEYVKDMNLNTIRFEGMLERARFLERCDEDGILVIAGWCCCDHWEKWQSWKPEDHEIAAASLRDQIRRVRNHPSLIAWWYGSDFAPPAEVERRYLEILAEERWPNPAHSSASHRPAELTGPSGMKMNGPYDYVPPGYWFEDRAGGGATGFATEICPGPAVPPIESLERMFGYERRWPIDEVWNLHAGCKEFHNVQLFTEALGRRYGAPASLEDYARKAQLMTYETQRAMFEAYTRNKYRATGVIQWMLNDAWPSLIWHLYDYYLRQGGGYFGTKKACEPLHIQYSYDDRSVVVANSSARGRSGLVARARIYDLDSCLRYTTEASVDVAADAIERVFVLPEPAGIVSPYFVDLRLERAPGAADSINLYWLAPELDCLNWEESTWFVTPIASFADFRALDELPRATLEVQLRSERATGRTAEVALHNRGRHVAFFVEVRLREQPGGAELLPVLWEDNYVTLLPDERRTLRARLLQPLPSGRELWVEVSGYNVDSTTIGERRVDGAALAVSGGK